MRLLILLIWLVLKNSGLNDLNRHDNITGLSDLNSLFLVSKNQEQHALYILSESSDIRNLRSLKDLNSFNNLSGLNGLFILILSNQWLSLVFPSILASKLPILAS